jgi:S-adenosylmethionine:tRNA ribosyltransferase-isomerase
MCEKQDRDYYQLQNYYFHLPQELIAQYPVEPRDASQLLVLDRKSGQREDRRFRDIVEYLQPGDTLVLNDTRVIPARLRGYKRTGAQVELLLLKKVGENWEALVKPARRLKAGDRVLFEDSKVEVEIMGELPLAGGRLLRIVNCLNEEAFLESKGHIPLPPYINREDEAMDVQRYQTVYARQRGSAAAPTAGLHFTKELLQSIRERGVNITSILLHVGLGTFRPVSCTDIREHRMHSEYYELDQSCAQVLNDTRAKGRKIIAVGTTVVRTLETVYNEAYIYQGSRGYTDKYIYPGYEIKGVDAMITNFHLPASSLLMLVAAFGGLEQVLSAYQHAVEARYRFFSYGDAMLIK